MGPLRVAAAVAVTVLTLGIGVPGRPLLASGMDLRVLVVTDGGPGADADRRPPARGRCAVPAGRPAGPGAAGDRRRLPGRRRTGRTTRRSCSQRPTRSADPELGRAAGVRAAVRGAAGGAYIWPSPRGRAGPDGLDRPARRADRHGHPAAAWPGRSATCAGRCRSRTTPRRCRRPTASWRRPPARPSPRTSTAEAPAAPRGVLVGVYTPRRPRELVLTFAYNPHQQQFRLLAPRHREVAHPRCPPGPAPQLLRRARRRRVRWPTTAGTPSATAPSGDVDCANGGRHRRPIRMVPPTRATPRLAARPAASRSTWSTTGAGSVDEPSDNGADPLDRRRCWPAGRLPLGQPHLHATRTSAACRTSRWCPGGAPPTRRRRHPVGEPRPTSATRSPATRLGAGTGCRSTTGELVTGEHSGLKTLPQQPAGQPEPGARAGRQRRRRGSPRTTRASREQRTVGPAATVPRLPDERLLQRGHRRRAGRRVQLDLHPPGRRRQRHLRGQPGHSPASSRWTRPPASGHIVPLETRIALTRPRQRPAAALRAPVQPGRGPHALPGAGRDPGPLPGACWRTTRRSSASARPPTVRSCAGRHAGRAPSRPAWSPPAGRRPGGRRRAGRAGRPADRAGGQPGRRPDLRHGVRRRPLRLDERHVGGGRAALNARLDERHVGGGRAALKPRTRRARSARTDTV